LVINEFMAANTSNARDPQGQYDDWIEIYNQPSGRYPRPIRAGPLSLRKATC
jgi:hypothetical protein